MINENFKKWACSLSGCDGGEIKADTWLCGIEWGNGSYDDGKYYKENLPKEIENGEIKLEHNTFDWKDSITYKYGISFAKLYTAIKGEKDEDYSNVANLTGKELFKLNLYPIAFDSTDHKLWEKYNLDEITGFKNKHLFNTWCFFNRFPYFSKLRKEKKPKLIIATGVDYLRDFLMFFGGSENIGKLETGTIQAESESNKYERTYYHIKIDETLLVVVPFFSGRYGLNSNYLLEEMGKKIKDLLEKEN